MRGRRASTLVLGLLAVAAFLPAQAPTAYTARLSWVPVSTGEPADVAGLGAAHATLTGDRVSITGTFEGLPAPATRASLRHGVATGAGGPAIAELDVTNGVVGTFGGEVGLESDDLAALLAGHLYVQLHAERGMPPDNAVLRGWLLPNGATASSPRRAAPSTNR